MVAEWDSTLKEHIRRKQNHEIQFHYLSHKIQNELILLIAAEIKGAVLKKIKEAKYFSVILDCTPDISKEEQMTLIIRCVDVSTVPIQVQEYFLQFLVVNDTTGQGLFEELKNVLHHLDLDINDVRGQGYDNGSNMKGKHKGVQKKLLDINPRAFYTPCGSHSLNLTLSDVANSCEKAEEFFGVVQRIYTLFADSTKRWDILKDNISEKGYTLKSLSTTRWESRIDSVKAIVTQAPEIREALNQLAERATESGIKSEAKCLAEYELGKFEFIVGMVIWYHILAKVNIVSKELQSENMWIDVAMGSVKALIAFFKEYREEGFKKALNCAKEIAAELDIDPVFPEKKKKRKVHKKRHFDEIDTETQPSEQFIEESSQESFRVHYFVYIIDQAIGSLERRFEQYEQYEETFGFLFTAKKLKSLDADELKRSCNNLEKKLENGYTSDIDGEDLFNELELLQKNLPNEHDTASAILNFLKRANCYPTSCLAYRILLTIPVTVASAERSFSKLKILKSYLRSAMSQERLNALALISIEHEFLEKLDYERLIDDFASKSARRSVFRK
uniref:zinc finger MYM-type protein 1-like n=1 Tax=Fragaria vesca subsp. vesca TaxID=101020 RepID=UPI0005C9987D|nr:PREDICTED: zinc finger MYM-type protein 1-like [Fragaria vesca subsp. vesca]